MKLDFWSKNVFVVLIISFLAVSTHSAEIIDWGWNGYDPPDSNDFIAITVGWSHSLTLKSDGSIVGWGENSYGQSDSPDGNDFVTIAAGRAHSLALKSDGSIVGWGWNFHGLSEVPAGNNFVEIAAGYYHSLALESDGSIVGWGYNKYGQTEPPDSNDFIAIAAGFYHSLALKSDGSIVGWGGSDYGEAEPPDGNDFIAIAAGWYHGLALKSDGSIVGWGWNFYGQVEPPDGNDFIAIAAGWYHSLALKSDGSIVGWGRNEYGQANPPDGNDFIAIAAGRYHSLALRSGVRNIPPVACIAGGDQIVDAGSDCEARVVLDGSCSSDEDSTPGTNDDINDFDWYEVIDPCDANSDILLGSGEIIECNLPLGEHNIILEVTDKAGVFDCNEATITVEDTTPPIISLNGSAIVILECGVDSYSEEGATATDNCDENVEVVIGGDTVDTSTCGTYAITYDATDDSGNPVEQVARTVIVEDTMPPEFSLWVEPNVLWPVNHKMVEITPSWVLSDHCDEWPDVMLVSITMDEEDNTLDNANTTDDIVIDPNGVIWMRAERSGTGTGRVYTITYQAVDDSNNITVDSAAVTVPHDMR